jgi:hypothetical protein
MSLLTQASLVVTPNGVKEGKLYSVIPSDGSGDMSVVRATTATRVNSSGLVELVPYNLVQYSEQLDNAAVWVAYSGTTTTANAATAPNGTLTADRIQGATGAFRGVRQTCSVNTDANTFSVYLKSATGSTQNIRIWNGATSSVITLTTEWQRFTLTSTATSNSIQVQISTAISSSIDVYAWGAQLVEGSTAKDYQKTETRLNIPRLDYSNGTCPSLLVEPQRTNLLTYSSSFSNAAWIKFNASISANVTATLDPSGNYGASKIVEDSGSSFHDIDQVQVYSAGANTISVYAKAAGRNHIFLQHFDGSSFLTSGTFNLSNGTVSGNGTIQSVGNGWYRCSFTATTVNGTGKSYINLSNGTTGNYQGDGTSGVYVYGAQLEVGSYGTSYIPTTSASVTRNADVISKTGISSLIGQTEGTLFLDFVLKNPLSSVNRILSITEPVWNTGGSIRLELDSTKIEVDMVNGGTSIAKITYNTTPAQNVRYKIAIAYKQNDCQLYVNGIDAGSDTTTGAMPTCSELYLNALGGGFNAPYEASNINAAALWTTRLTNDQLTALTTL